ncbi:12484_t:CDS:2 [Acaulospora morrowiae]|uniref:12484_t:CDS:1 n=1 Tax=Acaulospora morrowiae TaxID=94023 RepID=A0A9N9CNE7_9GLOM|nr:12484_t:CDS:2 [Acaulospora morrowiae]
MADKYDTSIHKIYEIWKRHAEGIPLCKQQIIHSVVSSEIIPKDNTSDRKSKKRKPESSSIGPAIFLANKVGIINILIKKVDEMDDLQARLAQNYKEREETKCSRPIEASYCEAMSKALHSWLFEPTCCFNIRLISISP